ncbi:MAG: HAD family hydrolase [Acidimicrobiales bacterium]
MDAVTFDFWNTLIYEERGHLKGRRLAAWARLLEEAGFPAEREALDAVYDRAWDTYVRSWHANEQFVAVAAATQIVEDLGYPMSEGLRQQLIAAFTTAIHDADVHATPHVGDCLERLRSAGVVLGVICDVGFTPSRVLRVFLDKHGLLDFFSAFSFSDEVGHYKPAPQIFEHALAALGNPVPERVAHVGDISRTDVAGAKAMGMIAIRYTGISDDNPAPAAGSPSGSPDAPPADFVVDSHDQVPAVLGLG